MKCRVVKLDIWAQIIVLYNNSNGVKYRKRTGVKRLDEKNSGKHLIRLTKLEVKKLIKYRVKRIDIKKRDSNSAAVNIF